jgi:hypothetical protein
MKIIFTEHAKFRMKKRHITKEEIINAINYSDKTLKKAGKFYAQKNIGRATIEVVYEKDKYINIITVYHA